MGHDTRPPPLHRLSNNISYILSLSDSLLKASTEHHAQCSWSYLLLAPHAAPSCKPMEQMCSTMTTVCSLIKLAPITSHNPFLSLSLPSIAPHPRRLDLRLLCHALPDSMRPSRAQWFVIRYHSTRSEANVIRSDFSIVVFLASPPGSVSAPRG
ncbi:hypothetical protein FIBSPDRAFT_289071 [Athelia psychrophila]|uniref:Uncharacterized protein n=1 Tax=Athelia psychrophila TaxID=1759441 RepID=A0A167XKG5_9AGAM|nr:hypothetical protein FIBSPDRAFT_289071 [Fibularhizoctonia sp. CBS 109695]